MRPWNRGTDRRLANTPNTVVTTTRPPARARRTDIPWARRPSGGGSTRATPAGCSSARSCGCPAARVNIRLWWRRGQGGVSGALSVDQQIDRLIGGAHEPRTDLVLDPAVLPEGVLRVLEVLVPVPIDALELPELHLAHLWRWRMSACVCVCIYVGGQRGLGGGSAVGSL